MNSKKLQIKNFQHLLQQIHNNVRISVWINLRPVVLKMEKFDFVFSPKYEWLYKKKVIRFCVTKTVVEIELKEHKNAEKGLDAKLKKLQIGLEY